MRIVGLLAWDNSCDSFHWLQGLYSLFIVPYIFLCQSVHILKSFLTSFAIRVAMTAGSRMQIVEAYPRCSSILCLQLWCVSLAFQFSTKQALVLQWMYETTLLTWPTSVSSLWTSEHHWFLLFNLLCVQNILCLAAAHLRSHPVLCY